MLSQALLVNPSPQLADGTVELQVCLGPHWERHRPAQGLLSLCGCQSHLQIEAILAKSGSRA